MALRGRLTVGQHTLDVLVQVRVLAPQPCTTRGACPEPECSEWFRARVHGDAIQILHERVVDARNPNESSGSGHCRKSP